MNYLDLMKFGLNKNESRVYYALLNKKEATASELLKSSNLHRNIIYDNLERLIEKGLVSFVIDKKVKRFVAEDPKTILGFLNSKKNKIDTQINTANKIIPDINKILSKREVTQKTTVLRGKDGIKKVILDILDYNVYWSIGITNESTEFLGYHFWKNFDVKKINKKIKDYLLFNSNFININDVVNPKYSNVRMLPKELDQVTEIYLYGDTVAITVYSLHPLAIVIKDSNIFKTFKKHFDFLWKLSKPVKLKKKKELDLSN